MNPDLPLRDIHLPAEIGWWPLAWGWWALLLLVLLLLAGLIRWWIQRKPVQRLLVLQPALRELDRIEHTYRDDPHALAQELSVLLRRIAISLYGRKKAAGLTGNAWLEFLDQQRQSHVFSKQFRQALTELPYQPRSDANVMALLHEIRQWLKSRQEGSSHV